MAVNGNVLSCPGVPIGRRRFDADTTVHYREVNTLGPTTGTITTSTLK